MAGKALVCTTLLEHEMLLLEQAPGESGKTQPDGKVQSGIVETANRTE
jgi:hypothetical protein